MPRYKYNPDGTLTILDDSPSSHQPDSDPPGGGGNGDDRGVSLLRARMHVLMVLLGAVAVAFMLFSLTEQGGEFSQFAHKMDATEWTSLREGNAPHNVMDVLSKSMGGHRETGLDTVGAGLSRCFPNLDANLRGLGEMAEEGVRGMTGS